jgi:elongator complex protein 1
MYVSSGTLNPAFIAPKWDTEDPNLFHFFSSSSTDTRQLPFFNTVTIARENDTSCGKVDDDLALVAVIDGQTVKVTPMREAVIPPPMSAYEIHVESPVTAVMFQHCSSADGQLSGIFSSNNLAVVTKNKVFFFSITDGDKGTKNLGDEDVKITGAGGNGYIVQTSRHTLHNNVEGNNGLNQSRKIQRWKLWLRPSI